MESDMKSRINAARHLHEEIIRIAALDQGRLSERTPGEGISGQAESMQDYQASHGGALPVSPPNNLSGRLLRVVASDARTKEETSNRLYEIKVRLIDLSERQLNDLLDAAPAGREQEIEDVDKLLVEMRSSRQGMETIVAIEAVLDQS